MATPTDPTPIPPTAAKTRLFLPWQLGGWAHAAPSPLPPEWAVYHDPIQFPIGDQH